MSTQLSAVPTLFEPIQVGEMKLAHRVVLAPQTRLRNDCEHVPTDLVTEWYAQRASISGTLLIAEATYISPQASGRPLAPGIWNDEQIASWRKVSSAFPPFHRNRFLTGDHLSSILGYRWCPRQGLVHLPPTMGSGTYRTP